jgi:SAM-dependent methyltransferase
MEEFWEKSFRNNKVMWGWEPTVSANRALELFKKKGFKTILIPGFGYGRNAKLFADNGFEVTGIEISNTAIRLANKQFGNRVIIHHGSVNDMPFDSEKYDCIYCYSLIHLLDEKSRTNLIKNCYNQLTPGGYMVFVTISKHHYKYELGEETKRDSLAMPYGVTLYFYDKDTIMRDFEAYGLIDASLMDEPKANEDDKPSRGFWYIVCKKDE